MNIPTENECRDEKCAMKYIRHERGSSRCSFESTPSHPPTQTLSIEEKIKEFENTFYKGVRNRCLHSKEISESVRKDVLKSLDNEIAWLRSALSHMRTETENKTLKSVEEVLRDNIVYIGNEIPEALTKDKRDKQVYLGYPQKLIDDVCTVLAHMKEEKV